jgi:hypothetical protein
LIAFATLLLLVREVDGKWGRSCILAGDNNCSLHSICLLLAWGPALPPLLLCCLLNTCLLLHPLMLRIASLMLLDPIDAG